VDAAIRRRFAFVEMHPHEPPVKDVLAGFLGAAGRAGDERAGLLRALNEAIEDHDRDFRIGPSYLMKPDAGEPGGLERVWKYDLLPLLEEHYYGRMTRAEVHGRFGLAALRNETATGGPPPAAGNGQAAAVTETAGP
jgi:5-methylcytosine-specific restriction protein B